MGIFKTLRSMGTTALVVLVLIALPVAIYIIGFLLAVASIFMLGYFLVTQYFKHKSDSVDQVNPK
jgi:hypothetical protein